MARIRLTPAAAAGGSTAQGGGAVPAVMDEAAPWLVRMARVGYAAKGVIHMVIGALAALAAIGSGGGTTDSRGALGAIGGTTTGRALLVVMGVGLVAYALWALIAAAVDAERRGSEPRGLALRAGLAGRGLLYAGLGVEAIRLFLTARASGGGEGAEHWTGRLLDLPAGQWIVGAAGVSVIAYAVYQWWRAARKDLRKRMHLGEVGPGAATWVLRLARFGIAARGVVFLVIGWFLVQAGVRHDADRAGGIDESLRSLAEQPYGPVILGVVAVGLMAFGVWQLVRSRYREMRVS